jgi:hypothetical protein
MAGCVIEFLGQAGSGKTKLSNALASSLRAAGNSVLTTKELGIIGPARRILENISLVWISIWILHSYSALFRIRSLVFMKRWLAIQGRIMEARNRNVDFVIIDEGYLHILRGLRRISIHKLELDSLLREKKLRSLFCQPSNILVYVYCSPKVLLTRLMNRRDGKSTLDRNLFLKYDPFNNPSWDDVEYVKNNTDVRVIAIRNDSRADLTDSIKRISRIVKRHRDNIDKFSLN